jgi:hypothetical protein
VLSLAAACSTEGEAGNGSTDATGAAGASSFAGTSSAAAGSTSDSSGTAGATATAGSANNASGSGNQAGSGSGSGGSASGNGGGGSGSGGGASGNGGSAGSAGAASSCTGKAWPSADPTSMGSFQTMTEKNVGPLAGELPDPVYGNTQQRFNVYRPKDLADGYCHPILIWNNGHGDNPEPNPPACVTGNGQYCGSYSMVMQQMASHGFVVVASLSTITSEGDPMPGIVGLDWILEQAEDATTPYYHRLDTAHIGMFGHSMGGMATCKGASDPRISAIATVSGTAMNPGIHQPTLLFCGEKDTVVKCPGVMDTYNSVKDYPAVFVDNLSADHGGWLYQNGAKGPDIFGMTAWFRVHLMNDTANRSYFYGQGCKLCTDSRVTITRNAFLTQ